MKKKLLIITLLSFMIITLTGCGSNSSGSSTKKSMGNTSSGNLSGNLANNGLVVENKDYIFHALYEGNGIYKLDKKEDSIFKSEVFIPNIYAYDLNIVGDYLYYVAYEDNSPNEIEIRKTKVDGSDTETIAKVPSDSYHLQLNVTKDWIYYYSDKEEAIYKISINGGNNEKVAEVYADRGMYVSDGWIYYGSGKGKLGKIKIDGSNDTSLFSGSINSNSMIVDNGYVYFWPYEYNGSHSKMYKINSDGSNDTPTQLSEQYINIYDNWMYYSNGYNEGYSKLKLDDSSQIKLIEKAKYTSYGNDSILVTEDWVYGYIPISTSQWAIFEVRHDGTDYQIKDCYEISNAKCDNN